MLSLLRSFARLPGLFELRRQRACAAFLGHGGGMFWGQFGSAREATAFLPATKRSNYQDPKLLALNESVFKQIHSFDWPVMFYLQKFLREHSISTLIDFGGHVGVKYHAFREPLGLADDFRWQVVDTPAMVASGRKQAAAQGLENLRFCESLQEVEASPLLLCSGVLQYTPETLEELLADLAWQPDFLILNKLPLIEGKSFYTLENFGEAKLPYRIFGGGEHESMRKRMGYRCAAQWPIPSRDFSIPFSKPRKNVRMVGEVWRREAGSAKVVSGLCG